MSDFLLTIKIRYSVLDLVAARQKAKDILNKAGIEYICKIERIDSKPEYKLQKVFVDQQPIGIDL